MMARLYAAFSLVAITLAACNRVAGTEVGNPEIAVSARFVLVDTSADIDVPELNLKVMGMAYGMAGDSGECWTDPHGHMVDFASPAMESALPMAKAKDAQWTGADVLLQSPSAAAILPDTDAFMSWYNPRYAKMFLIEGTDTLHALFDMPQGMGLTLRYGKEKIAKWRTGDTMQVKVIFDVGKWAAGIGPKGAWTLRQDGKHVRYALFSEDENAAAWTVLKGRLPESFLADSASMR